MRHRHKVLAFFAAVFVLGSLVYAVATQSPKPPVPFVPEQWSGEDLDSYLGLQNPTGSPLSRLRMQQMRSTESSRAMIGSTSEPFAVHAGLEVLKYGGNAADAAITTSLAQIALTAGAAISYAGVMTAVYYDAASDEVYTLSAGYNTVKNETDPTSIPPQGQSSGRTALVPGFMAGAQALHDRFGKLPFADLFGPAIWVADHGVPFSGAVDAWFRQSRSFVTRLPEAKRIFLKENGEAYTRGEPFRQPELAETLRRIASQGAAYMYTGDWAQHFVDAVQREGGKMTLADLASYRAVWDKPLRMSYRDYEVVSLGAGSLGGYITLGGLRAAEVADLKKYGHYTTSPDALYQLIQIFRLESNFAGMSPDARLRLLPGVDPSLESQVTTDTANRVVARIRRLMQPVPVNPVPASDHSAGVVAVDEQGNVAAVLHTINTVLWGTTGIFVDGISIPDSATFQQRQIATVGPGGRLPDTTNPLIVLKGGKPVLASATVGSALHTVTMQIVLNILDFGMDPKTAVDQPNTQGPYIGMVINGQPQPEYEKETVHAGEFSQEVLDGVRARGQEIKSVTANSQDGYWIGIQIDPETGKLRGAATSKLPAILEGY